MKVYKATSRSKANFPYLVQVKNTENWNTLNAFPDDAHGIAQAWCRAEGIARKYPALPVRVLHCTGGRIS